MAFFKKDYNRPGPGVPKNAPRKKGVGRFFEVFGRDMANLIKLNVIYLVCLLPAQAMFFMCMWAFVAGNLNQIILFAVLALVLSILVGPANTAMNYILTKMLRDDPGFVWHDFRAKFKENFKSMALPGVFYSLVVGGQVFAFIFYTSATGEGGMSFLLLALFIFSVLIFYMAAPYFFLQAAYLEMRPSGLLRNSLLMALGYLPRSFMGALLGAGLVILQLALFPYSTMGTIIVGYTLPGLLNMMWIWPQVNKTFNIEKTLKKREDDQYGEGETITPELPEGEAKTSEE